MCATLPYMNNTAHSLKTRKVLCGPYRTPSHQYGYYEMRTQESTGKRRSYFKVLVNLDQYEDEHAALKAWPTDVERLEAMGKSRAAAKLQVKLERLRELA